MKWTYEPGELFSVMAFTQDEVKILVQILSGKVHADIKKKFEKYEDIHNSGEATERQEDLKMKYEEQLSLIEYFLLETQAK